MVLNGDSVGLRLRSVDVDCGEVVKAYVDMSSVWWWGGYGVFSAAGLLAQ